MWARQGSNLRPLACKARALPLSYAPRAPQGRWPGRRSRERRTGAPSRGSGRDLPDGVLPAGLLSGVTGLVDLGEGDLPLGVDEEGPAQGHAGLVVEHAVGLGGGAVRPEVRQQGEVEALLRLERLEAEDGIGA